MKEKVARRTSDLNRTAFGIVREMERRDKDRDETAPESEDSDAGPASERYDRKRSGHDRQRTG